MLCRLLDIISGHYKESPYFYNPSWQLHEACNKLGIVTQLQVIVQEGVIAILWNGKRQKRMQWHSWICQTSWFPLKRNQCVCNEVNASIIGALISYHHNQLGCTFAQTSKSLLNVNKCLEHSALEKEC